jgi:hypothetical protein
MCENVPNLLLESVHLQDEEIRQIREQSHQAELLMWKQCSAIFRSL